MIKKLEIENFRLLREVELTLEEKSTIIVGRNNSGKTSLTEIFRRLLADKTPSFTIYDFSLSCIEGFKKALKLYLDGSDPKVVRDEIPVIEIKLTIDYDISSSDLGTLGDFIVDLNPDCNEILIVVKYQLQDGKLKALFEEIKDQAQESISAFIKLLKERIPKLYEVKVFAQDPNDNTNNAVIEYAKFRQLIGAGFINAQRGLDDITHTEKDVLGKVLAKLFKTANATSAPSDMKEKSEELQIVIKEIQQKVDTDFNEKLDKLLPALQIFGYPGLADPNLSTETTIDISNILDSHTRIRYSQGDGLFLPETYNGLGSRNLIYILFQLFEFFRDWQSKPVSNGLYLVFIEEPEAHLHPQMQQVFIKQINEIAIEFANTLNNNMPWPVQFIITTHSTHIANEAKFDAIRYFLTSRNEQKETKIKDLRKEFSASTLKEDKEFLHKYLTLTKCDLYFADKAILIEGPTERILMPVLISKVDDLPGGLPKLNTQYVTLIEVGGTYAHHFFKFLDFLELRTLVITDIDAAVEVKKSKTVYTAAEVAKATHSTNAAIKSWFAKGTTGYLKLKDFADKKPAQKENGARRIAFQISEQGRSCCGRSFEDAFMLANPKLFKLTSTTDDKLASEAYKKVPGNNEKTDFALKYALEETNWSIPLYIAEGLQWLAKNPNQPSEEVHEAMINIIEESK